MKEFKQLLKNFNSIEEILSPLKKIVSRLKSRRLKNLLSNDDERRGGLFPKDLRYEIDEYN